MSANAALAIAALVTSVTGAGLGLAGLWRSARAEDAKTSADLSRIGLEAVQVGMATQDRALTEALRTINHQQGEIGELRGELRNCKTEREAIAARAEEAVARAEDLALELAEVKRRLS